LDCVNDARFRNQFAEIVCHALLKGIDNGDHARFRGNERLNNDALVEIAGVHRLK
jgi:hypothetical protein